MVNHLRNTNGIEFPRDIDSGYNEKAGILIDTFIVKNQIEEAEEASEDDKTLGRSFLGFQKFAPQVLADMCTVYKMKGQIQANVTSYFKMKGS